MTWEEVQAVIAETPADDREAQWSVVTVCCLCHGPAISGRCNCVEGK